MKFEMIWEEERIFLFIDLKKSAFLAERLGNKYYSYLITNCISDLFPIANKYKAKMQELISDRIILSWARIESFLPTIPIQLFFEFQKQLALSSKKYVSNFGIFPEFKATANIGYVAVTHCLIAIDEPVYRGSALKTCIGLLKLCEDLDKSIIVTEAFANLIGQPTDFKLKELGRYFIIGKMNFENVYAIEY